MLRNVLLNILDNIPLPAAGPGGQFQISKGLRSQSTGQASQHTVLGYLRALDGFGPQLSHFRNGNLTAESVQSYE